MPAKPLVRSAIRELASFGAVLIVLLVLHRPAVTLPHHWDALNRVHNAHTIAAHDFSPFLPAGVSFLDTQGRPPLLLQLLALTVPLRPHDLLVAHLLWIGFASLAILATFRLGRRLWGAMVGAIAAIWLASNPLFFAQSEIVVLEMPVTALTVSAALFLVEQRRVAYFVTATMLVLSKEAAQLALPGFVLFAWWAAPRSRRWRAAAVAASPFAAFLVWISACKLYYGWFFHPFMSSFVRFEEGRSAAQVLAQTSLQLLTLVFQLGFWDGNWGPTLLLLGSAALAREQRPRATAVAVILSATAAGFVLYPQMLVVVRERLAPAAGVVTGALLQETYLQLGRLRVVLPVAGALAFLALPALRAIDWRSPSLWLIIGLLGGYVGFLSVIDLRMIRYLLPAYPFLFLLAAAALWHGVDGSSRKAAALAAGVVLLFVAHHWGRRSSPGNILESNLEYRDVIAVRRAAAAYLEGVAPVRVLVSWPETMELRFPYQGYVSRPVTVIEPPAFDADVVYASPQSRDPDLAAALQRARPGVVLEPLFRAERNGKSVQLLRIRPPEGG
jgi:4-amino-4-deoxy-L-arabinose transferase-like glycosyltransferase